MTKIIRTFAALLLGLMSLGITPGVAGTANEKIVIAHRGASGYLPEHSLAAKAMAYGMGAHYIEQDVVMSKDDQLVVLHDIHLDRVTNVAEVFPGKKRADGRYYVIDFSWNEIRQLRMTERFRLANNTQAAVFPGRFPLWQSDFRVHRLADEIEMVQGLNKSTGKNVGIYPEIKSPQFHQSEGKDISRTLLMMLKQYGYQRKRDAVYVQCFDPREVRRIHDSLFAELNVELKLVQLIALTSWQETVTKHHGKTTALRL